MRLPSQNLRFIGCFVATAAVIAVAASSSPDAQEVKKRTGPRIVEVPIQGNKFNADKPVTVEVGDSVVWVNKDKMPHTAARYTEEDQYKDQPFNTGFIQPGKKSAPILFLKESNSEGLEYHCDVHEYTMQSAKIFVRPRTAPPPTLAPPSPLTVHPQPPAPVVRQRWPTEHSMVATGSSGSAIFMHHYGLFNNPDHEFHVTVEARLDDAGARKDYEDYRAKFGQVRVMMDTKELFMLTDIESGARPSFASRFSHTGDKEDLLPKEQCRQKDCIRKQTTAMPAKAPRIIKKVPAPELVETQWGWVIPGLNNVGLTITRIIQFRHYHPKAWYPKSLIYQLYGNEKEVFLAHEITAGPSFEHVVQLAEIPTFLTPEVIRNNPLVSIPAKQLRAGGPRSVRRTAVLNDNTHFLLAPPTGALNAEAPLQDSEVITVLIQGDRQLRQLKVGRTIFFDSRILNR